jgi:hypothetical protein
VQRSAEDFARIRKKIGIQETDVFDVAPLWDVHKIQKQM